MSGRNTGNGSGVFGQSSGEGNGVFGRTGAGAASGVYGENTGGGFGVAGRSNQPGGIGVFGEALGSNGHAVAGLSSGTGGALLGTNNGGGPALELHTNPGAPPMTVDQSVKVDNLNADMVDGHHSSDFLSATGKAADADKVDGLDSSQLVVGDGGRGGRIFSNRIAPAVDGQILLIIPGWGHLIVDKCDGSVGRLAFAAQGTGNFDLMYSALYDTGPEEYSVITNLATTLTHFKGFVTMNIARDTWTNSKILTIWASWYSNGCRFQAQALESPQI